MLLIIETRRPESSAHYVFDFEDVGGRTIGHVSRDGFAEAAYSLLTAIQIERASVGYPTTKRLKYKE